MSDLLLDPITNDLVIQNGDLVLVGATSDVDDIRQSIAQDIKTNLLFFLGEWFFDTTAGVPWLDDVFVKDPNPVLVDDTVKNVILNVPGVLGLETFSMSYIPSSRTFTIDFDVRTTAGPIEFSQELIVP